MSRFLLSLILAVWTPLLLWGCEPSGDDDDDDDDDSAVGDDDAGDDDTSAPAYYGPENSWWHAYEDDVPADLAGTGWSNGDIATNFTLTDQFGDEVELYQFYGQVIVLDVFAYW